MTRSELLEVVHRFYPRGILCTEDRYEDAEERHRQREVARRAVAGYPTWRAMTRRLGGRYPCRNYSIGVLAPRYVEKDFDPGYLGDIEIPGHHLGFGVSLLGPYYGIKRTGAPGEESAALHLAREIEATYPGYEPIPPELGNEEVPDVCLEAHRLGEGTIYECLLSQQLWAYSSGPCPPPSPSRVPPGCEPCG